MASRHGTLFLPIVILLAMAVVVFYPALKRPLLGKLFQAVPRASTAIPAVKIWANKRSGFYYCPDSKLYGKLTPGVYMSQGEALQGGYQPASKETCR